MKVLVNDKTPHEAIDVLDKEHEVTAYHFELEELVEKIAEYDALLIRSATKIHDPRIFENASKLKVIGRAGIGVDNIDLVKATEMGIPIVFAPTGSTHSVAELAIGHMLAFARNIVKGTNSVKEGKWEKTKLMGSELYGKTLGLLGCGNIGQLTAELGQAFGMEIIYNDIVCYHQLDAELVDFDELFKKCDYISLHLPKTEKTAGMISDEQFKMMKNSAVLVNCARGGVVDEAALYRALKAGEIGGATMDVYEKEPISPNNPLLTLDNIIFTPHLGANTKEAQIRAGTMTAEGILDVLAGRQPKFCKNPQLFH
ncbi:MAG: hydroxyacid dehydrogenase [Candidatus Thermoplasmatota archaeon]|nr:hydroxyacid dehydrogenase [Candidatus Thermoplasmatota archaeon]MDP7265166.1 hydroxyacid dehydrogenase [Candidatus Thermoplasmatota archaeon]